MSITTVIITLAGRPLSAGASAQQTDWPRQLSQERAIQEALLDKLLNNGYVKFSSDVVVEAAPPYSVRLVAVLFKPSPELTDLKTGPQAPTVFNDRNQPPALSSESVNTEYPPKFLEWDEQSRAGAG